MGPRGRSVIVVPEKPDLTLVYTVGEHFHRGTPDLLVLLHAPLSYAEWVVNHTLYPLLNKWAESPEVCLDQLGPLFSSVPENNVVDNYASLEEAVEAGVAFDVQMDEDGHCVVTRVEPAMYRTFVATGTAFYQWFGSDSDYFRPDDEVYRGHPMVMTEISLSEDD